MMRRRFVSNSYDIFAHLSRATRWQMVLERNTQLYRITLVDHAWHVRRPAAMMDHAFGSIDDAMSFVRNDSGGTAEFIEVVAENIYMVKKLENRT